MVAKGTASDRLIVVESIPIDKPTIGTEELPLSVSAEDLQRIAVETLMGVRGQTSAADALSNAEWTIQNNELVVQTELSKTMLPIVINSEADKIVRNAIRSAGASSLKVTLLHGNASTSSAKKPRPAKIGSVQAKAMEHPIV